MGRADALTVAGATLYQYDGAGNITQIGQPRRNGARRFGMGTQVDLTYDLTIQRRDGDLEASGTHTRFPSLEVWVYEDGKEPQLIYHYDAPAGGFFQGTIDINRMHEIEAPDGRRRSP